MQIATIQPRGFVKDLDPIETGPEVYNDLANVVFNDGFAGYAPGWEQVPVDLLCRPLWILPVFTATVYYWIYAGNNDAGTAGVLAVTDGTINADITPAGGLSVTNPGDWTGGVLNGIPVINNGVDDPMWWDLQPGNAAQILPDWPANTRCKALRPFKFHLIAMNVQQAGVDFPDLVLHSDAADPGTIPQSWTPAPDNQAGSFSIATITGGIIDGAQLRDLFMVYKQGSTALIQFTGGQFIFATRRVFVETGILARNAAQEYRGKHYMITDGDLIMHNGQEQVSLVDGTLRDWIFAQVSSDFAAAHVAIDHGNKQVWFNLPTGGEQYCNLSLIWDLTSQSMGVLYYAPFAYMTRGILGDLGLDTAWDAQTGAWQVQQRTWNESQFNAANDQLLFVRYQEKEFNQVFGTLRNGAPSESSLQLLSKDLGYPTQYKTLDRVYVNGSSGALPLETVLTGRIGVQEDASDPIRWSPVLTLHRGKSLSYAISGRYISIELLIDQRDFWRLNSMDLHFLVDGT